MDLYDGEFGSAAFKKPEPKKALFVPVSLRRRVDTSAKTTHASDSVRSVLIPSQTLQSNNTVINSLEDTADYINLLDFEKSIDEYIPGKTTTDYDAYLKSKEDSDVGNSSLSIEDYLHEQSLDDTADDLMSECPPSSSNYMDSFPESIRQKAEQSLSHGFIARGLDSRPAWLSSQSPLSDEVKAAAASEAQKRNSAQQPQPPETKTRINVGLRIMMNMNYRPGEGLGKHGTGIVGSLVHQRTGRNKGVIRQADLPPEFADVMKRSRSPVTAQSGSLPATPEPKSSAISVCGVIFSLDDPLIDEMDVLVRSACQRYGHVLHLCTFVTTNGECMILVRFKDATEASRAVDGLSGSEIGGRVAVVNPLDDAIFDKLTNFDASVS